MDSAGHATNPVRIGKRLLDDADMMRVMFLIPSLEQGGAERQLVELLKGLDKTRFAASLVAFYDGGAFRSEVEGIEGVNVVSLRKSGWWDVLPFLFRMWRMTRAIRPDVVHGYMSFASGLSLLVGQVARAKVVWSLRASNMDYRRYVWTAGVAFKVGARLSRFADLIILNSYAGKQHHVASGYYSARMIVIHNGIDTERYCPHPLAGQQMRRRWGIAEEETAIGLVGRLDFMKDHPVFLQAAAQLTLEWPNVRFVCVGAGSQAYTAELQALSERLGLGKRLIWAGIVSDMPAVYNALDLLASTSYGEGFSNVIGEAMACGVPCVVTDVGDSALIVGETGNVVSAKDPEALARAWQRMLSMSPAERRALGAKARDRILTHFSRSTMVAATEAALAHLVDGSDIHSLASSHSLNDAG